MKPILTSASALALALALLAGAPAVAQEQTADAVMTGMTQLGMDTEGMVLTEEQVLQVQAVLSTTDDDRIKVDRIEELLGMN